MEENVLEDRKLYKFPGPYSLDCTPCVLSDFSEKTRRRCLRYANNKKFSTEWLKICKIIIIGDVSVGKTCLVNRFCRKLFDSNYKATIGVDFEVETFVVLGVSFILQIWDTAGQERFKSIAQSYYRGANVIILAFDLTNYESLTNCKKWLSEALHANSTEKSLLFLVGTKLDLINHFSYKAIKINATKLAKEINAEYWAVSSKTGKNVNKLFCRIAALSFDNIISMGHDLKDNHTIIGDKLLGIEKTKEQKKTCCNH